MQSDSLSPHNFAFRFPSQPVSRQQWQPDGSASACPLCSSSFDTFRRRHHCRWCGRVCCDDCSNRCLNVPNVGYSRVCIDCYQAYSTLHNGDNSDSLNTCPICSKELLNEDHLNECLSKGTNSLGSRYIMHQVANTSLGECSICLDLMVKGEWVAVLDCLCQFHKSCVEAWFSRGHACPVHTGMLY